MTVVLATVYFAPVAHPLLLQIMRKNKRFPVSIQTVTLIECGEGENILGVDIGGRRECQKTTDLAQVPTACRICFKVQRQLETTNLGLRTAVLLDNAVGGNVVVDVVGVS